MCGRFNLTASEQDIIDHFHLKRLPRHEISYNIPPGQKILNVVQLEDGSYKGVYLYWGLIPPWAKDRKIASHLINARSETLSEKPSFRNAFKYKRCLIPATGFFEWQQTETGKQPYHIYHKDHSLFAFAGLWEYWEHDGQTIYSCTIITTKANQLMEPIHDRMPVIIPPESYSYWLRKKTHPSELRCYFDSKNSSILEYQPISERINNPANNNKNCLE